MIKIFHCHIYFSEDEIPLATVVRDDLIKSLPQITYAGRLIPIPIGPHTKPMFEIHIPASDITTALPIIEANRQTLSVLIHPVESNELAAHTTGAIWLGEKVPLRLSALH